MNTKNLSTVPNIHKHVSQKGDQTLVVELGRKITHIKENAPVQKGSDKQHPFWVFWTVLVNSRNIQISSSHFGEVTSVEWQSSVSKPACVLLMTA